MRTEEEDGKEHRIRFAITACGSRVSIALPVAYMCEHEQTWSWPRLAGSLSLLASNPNLHTYARNSLDKCSSTSSNHHHPRMIELTPLSHGPPSPGHWTRMRCASRAHKSDAAKLFRLAPTEMGTRLLMSGTIESG